MSAAEIAEAIAEALAARRAEIKFLGAYTGRATSRTTRLYLRHAITGERIQIATCPLSETAAVTAAAFAALTAERSRLDAEAKPQHRTTAA